MIKPTLYAVATSRFVGKKVVTETVYLHAHNQAHARNIFTTSTRNKKGLSILAIGPVIGYNVNENGRISV